MVVFWQNHRAHKKIDRVEKLPSLQSLLVKLGSSVLSIWPNTLANVEIQLIIVKIDISPTFQQLSMYQTL
jgi:hypothetical protein